MLGMVLYCAASFDVDAMQKIETTAPRTMTGQVISALGAIGAGTLMWLAGACAYVAGGLRSDLNGPDLHF